LLWVDCLLTGSDVSLTTLGADDRHGATRDGNYGGKDVHTNIENKRRRVSD